MNYCISVEQRYWKDVLHDPFLQQCTLTKFIKYTVTCIDKPTRVNALQFRMHAMKSNIIHISSYKWKGLQIRSQYDYKMFVMRYTAQQSQRNVKNLTSGSVTFWYGSGSGSGSYSFPRWLSRCHKQISLFPKLFFSFPPYFLLVFCISLKKDNKLSKKSQNFKIVIFLVFLLAAGRICTYKYRSGSGRQNWRILHIWNTVKNFFIRRNILLLTTE
jgi:hypothetical protein